MSAVGSDAAYMLEKALEEMDDIFRESSDSFGFNTSTDFTTGNSCTPRNHMKFNEHVEKFKNLLNELELYLQWQVSENQQFFHYEKQAVLSHCRLLANVPAFFQELNINEEQKKVSP